MTLWVRDPLKRALELELQGETPLKTALRRLLARLGKPEGLPLIASPCDREKRVIDSHPGGPCDACQCDVWLSPSSVETMKVRQVVLLCLRCVEETARDQMDRV